MQPAPVAPEGVDLLLASRRRRASGREILHRPDLHWLDNAAERRRGQCAQREARVDRGAHRLGGEDVDPVNAREVRTRAATFTVLPTTVNCTRSWLPTSPATPTPR